MGVGPVRVQFRSARHRVRRRAPAHLAVLALAVAAVLAGSLFAAADFSDGWWGHDWSAFRPWDTTTTVEPTTAQPTATTAHPTTTAAPTTTTPSTTSTSTTAAPKASGVNSSTRILYSMDGAHEGPLADIPSSWSWGAHPSVGDVSPPSGWTSATAWGQVYADANFAGSEPAQGSVRVELKNMQSYVWSNSQSKWLQVQGTTQVDGAHYVDNFANNASIACDWRTEGDGGISSGLVAGYNVHFWPTGSRPTLPVPASDIGGVYTTVQARLIGTNVANAHYLLNVGGDWWQTPSALYPNNAGVGEGRFMSLSGSWAAYDFWTGGAYSANPPGWTDPQMTASNAPVDAMGLP